MHFDKILDYFKVENQEFSFQFQSHPNYPSALAFSDTLNFLGIKNNAYNLEKKYWNELSEEFLTIYKDKFSLVVKEKEQYKIYSDEEICISEKELLENSQNLVMLFEKNENKQSSKSSTINFNVFMLILLGVYVVFNFLQNDWISFSFNIVSLIGMYISYEIFSEKFGKISVALNTICGNTTKSNNSSCNKIINSDSLNVFGLKLSDLSLIYFVAFAILGLLLPNTGVILQIISLVSAVAIFYSLYIQVFVERSSCKICLIIIFLIIFQIILSRFFIVVPISSLVILASVLIFTVVFIGIIYINELLKKNDSLGKSNLKNLKFKRNYDVFKRELTEQKRINFVNNTGGFFLGNPDAKLHISIVSNPHCGFCKEAHIILEKLLVNYPDDISAQIRFNYFPENESEKSQRLMETLYSIYSNKGAEKFLNALHYWFENRNEEAFFEKYKNLDTLNMIDIINSSVENKKFGLNFTPDIILNGYPFPDKYDREDLFYFIDELLDDEQVVNG